MHSVYYPCFIKEGFKWLESRIEICDDQDGAMRLKGFRYL